MNTLKLTPNRRMSQYLQDTLSCQNSVSFDEWLSSFFPNALNESEELFLFENIIKGSEWSQHLLRSRDTARLALAAWNLCSAYTIKSDHFEQLLNITLDNQAYLSWSNEFNSICSKYHWICTAQRIDKLIEIIETSLHLYKTAIPESIDFIGFDEYTPQQIRLIECLKQNGIRIHCYSLVASSYSKKQSENMNANNNAAVTTTNNNTDNKADNKADNSTDNAWVLSAPNSNTELLWAAHQAKYWLNRNSNARIAIVVPNLELCRQTVERIFEETLIKKEYNIAAPLPLSSYPLIDAAIKALELVTEAPDIKNISLFLRSPFFAGQKFESNRFHYAAFDLWLREKCEKFISWGNLLEERRHYIKKNEVFFKKKQKQWLNDFLSHLQLFYHGFNQLNLHEKQTIDYWCSVLKSLLSCLGWGGGKVFNARVLNSQEQQLKNRWNTLLSDVCQLRLHWNPNHQKKTFYETLELIKTKAEETTFLPQSSTNAPIQILGILEASGMPFDYLWVTGLHRDNWPAEPSPNPFIPLSIQKQLNMPKSSAKRELEVAKRLIENFIQAASIVIFSFPAKDKEQECKKSTLLNALPELDINRTHLNGTDINSTDINTINENNDALNYNLIKIKSNLTHISRVFPLTSSEEKASVYTNNEQLVLGSRVLQLQSLCPFRAFAEVRLKARPILKKILGLANNEKGEIIHQVLMKFWEGFDGQDELLKLSDLELHKRLDDIVDSILIEWKRKHPITLLPQFQKMEKKRIKNLLLQFIELEKERPPFWIVEREKKHTITLNGLSLNVRIDRIDRINNINNSSSINTINRTKTIDNKVEDKEIIIDYKTGLSSINDWFGERPKDPQLPLYCITRFPLPEGIAFASILPSGPKYYGLSASKNVISGVKTVEELKGKVAYDKTAEFSKSKKFSKSEMSDKSEKSENAEGLWKKQCEKWVDTLNTLVEEFLNGKANVNPLEGENTCRTCSLQSLCRKSDTSSRCSSSC